MENPSTWTPLHWKIHNIETSGADRQEKIRQIRDAIIAESHTFLLEDEIEKVMSEHDKQREEHLCGLSLPSMIVNRLKSK